jgi:hypothetical protein
MVVCSRRIRRMSTLRFGSQKETGTQYMGGFGVNGCYVMWWLVSIEGHSQGQIKGCDLQNVVRV